ncbi:CpsD/CapB family tyrosine-protein kinase [Halalkalibacter urbisdiaboli]|uniref:CpsD/CapB family tyrosine-protein kinase n=1 Tax=Halalkalibacter urbisdiaboli TaxID=1960589 RepID=UPI000B439693|nr:CpsD/CapB family tyrosine-protein kinase [Halalkalibacter urbisdiaboli]
MAKQSRQANIGNTRNLITHHSPKSPISEQYRTLRTNLQFSADAIKSIVLTSSGPAEGKSTTVANLAVVLAQQGYSVVLVDADMRKPTVQYTFRVENRVGLTNVLTGQAKLEDAIKKTLVPELDVITSGPIPPNPSELLSSRAMEEFVAELLGHYDYVLFDTPPVLAVADAQILANLCDGSVLVVSSGKTDRQGAVKAKELLSQAKAKIVGAVLNSKEKTNDNYYYYYGTTEK